MRLGLVACSSSTGLGIETHDAYTHLSPTRTMVVDISDLNGTEQHPNWYPDGMFIKGFPLDHDIAKFVEGLDLIYIIESAYNDGIYNYARYRDVKTINRVNYEFFSHGIMDIGNPDAFISPSIWHYEDVQKYCSDNNLLHTYLHSPVDRKQFPFRKIGQAKTFIHSAGRTAAHDRAGTYSVIEASKYLKSDAKIIIHFQGEQGLAHQLTSTTQDYIDYAENFGDLSKIEFLFKDFDNPADIYKQGDVYVQPRRYGGNNLPMGEALSSGLPMIMTDLSPNNQFLPKEWLVPAYKKSSFTPRTIIDIYEADVKLLAERIDWFASLNKEQIFAENQKANALAEQISWTTLLPKYKAFFEQVIRHPNSA